MSSLLSTHAAAERTGLARQTLAKLRSVGGGAPFIRLGAKVFYPSAELEQWISSHPLRTSTADVGARDARPVK